MYDYSTIVSGQQIDATVLYNNFAHLNPNGTESSLSVGGDVTIEGDGSTARLNFVDTDSYIDFDGTALVPSVNITSAQNITALNLVANTDLFINHDSAIGDATIYANNGTEYWKFSDGLSAWIASQPIETRGRQMFIGSRSQAYGSGQSNILFTANANVGSGYPGLRYNYETNKMEVSHGSSWNEIGTTTALAGLEDTLAVSNTAFNSEAYVGTFYAQQSNGDNYILLDPKTSSSSPEIEFSVSGYVSGSFSFDGTSGDLGLFILNAPLLLKSGSEDPALQAGDILVGYQQDDCKIYFGAQSEPAYINVNAPTSYATFMFDTTRIVGDLRTDADVFMFNNYFQLGYAYSSGDQDCTIFLNHTNESWKFDYGEDATMLSPSELWIGDGHNEDIWCRFYNNATISGQTVPYGIKFDTSDNLFYATDASGTYLLSANTSGYLGAVGTLDMVTDNGATTTNTIEAAGLRSDGNIWMNYDGPDGDCYLYAYDASSESDEWLKFANTADRWELSNDLYVTGYVYATGTNIRINYGGPNSDSYLYFYHNGTAGAYLKWDEAVDGFETSHSLNVVGILQCDTLRIDQNPTVGSITPNQYITMLSNGIPCKIAVEV